MKKNSQFAGRIALTAVAFAAMGLTVTDARALGLGRLAVQSALGETLRAEIDVTSLTPEEASNLRIRIAPPESYRAAGVDYNSVLPGTQAVLQRRSDGRPYLRITSDRAVQEPFVDVILEISWSTGRLVREYTLLFDPPNNRATATAPAPSTSPSIAPAPAVEPPPAPARSAAPRAPRPAPVESPAPAPVEPRRAAARPEAPAAAAGADEYRVRNGDTLSRIAGRTQRPGVSLDQMLVSLYQANPQAFVDSNMNRLKSGVVLSVPATDVAKAITPAEAKQVIQAQSADFGAYRQRLASGVPEAKTDAPTRQAGGKVQSAVEDRKQTAASAPDKLTLSKGSAKASAPEERLSKQAEKKDAQTRVAELSKNVEELRKLSSATAASAAAKPAAAASKPAAAPIPAPVIVAAPPVVVPPPPPPPAPAPAPVPAPPPAPVVASAPVLASAPVVVASAPTGVASAVAPVPASAPVVAPVASTPMPAPVVPPVEEAPGPLASLLEDNPLALALGGGLLALLIGFGIYRFTKRSKKDSGETSFLESRLQPDSFFGASGGQRIDTRDAGGASSSMSYSLSQLDAIGDVDPVAEADVYLAYGRDLQAEEILKEAMRATPDRLAIRTKLLEVYAKRRDTKGFELLATQLYGLTNGQGEDWAKAQEIGLQIDPENTLYQPGGAPVSNAGDGGRPSELLGASTMPQSVLPSPSEFGSSAAPSSDFGAPSGSSVDLDLDLDADTPSQPAPMTFPPEATQPVATPPPIDEMSFDLPLEAPSSSFAKPTAAPAPTPAPNAMEFDLSSISLDLGDDTTVIQPAAAAPAPAAAPAVQSSDFGALDLDSTLDDDDADPINRKLELAEEFRQIGDMEGARDLLQEVIAKSSGTTKSRAQAMLESLG